MKYFISILIIFNSFAQDDQAFERYCFESVARSEKVYVSLGTILIPAKDKSNIDENCFEISTTMNRRDLISRYILTRFPDARVEFSSENNYKECNLELVVEKTKAATLTDASVINAGTISSTLSNVVIQKSEEKSKSSDSSSMKIRSGTPSQIQFGKYPMQITCKTQDDQNYQIDLAYPPANFNANNTPTTIIHQAGNNPIVLNNNPERVDCAANINCPHKINTSFNLKKGQWHDLGQITKDLDSSSQGYSIPNQAGMQTTQGQETINYKMIAN
jgi:hypothetical protein